jgi:hypothetical protein
VDVAIGIAIAVSTDSMACCAHYLTHRRGDGSADDHGSQSKRTQASNHQVRV